MSLRQTAEEMQWRYRYAWAERALKCGFPERFAQQALGHNSKAVHRAYAKHAEVTVPSLDDWEKEWEKNPHRNVQSKLLPSCNQIKTFENFRVGRHLSHPISHICE
jgi:hypothetical protein